MPDSPQAFPDPPSPPAPSSPALGLTPSPGAAPCACTLWGSAGTCTPRLSSSSFSLDRRGGMGGGRRRDRGCEETKTRQRAGVTVPSSVPGWGRARCPTPTSAASAEAAGTSAAAAGDAGHWPPGAPGPCCSLPGTAACGPGRAVSTSQCRLQPGPSASYTAVAASWLRRKSPSGTAAGPWAPHREHSRRFTSCSFTPTSFSVAGRRG